MKWSAELQLELIYRAQRKKADRANTPPSMRAPVEPGTGSKHKKNIPVKDPDTFERLWFIFIENIYNNGTIGFETISDIKSKQQKVLFFPIVPPSYFDESFLLKY